MIPTATTTVDVILVSCDENTHVEIEVTPAELAFLKRLAALTREASEYDCMPRMAVGTGELIAAEDRKDSRVH